MKTVLLLVHDDDGQEARLQAALDATRALGGHLTCVHVTEFVPLIGADIYGMSGAAAMVEVVQGIETENRSKLEARLANEDVPFDWVEITGALEPALRGAADLADLIVVNSEMKKTFQPQVYKLVEQLVVKSGKPILAVSSEQGFRPADPALVAWDGSDPASVALTAAVPLLQLSDSVTVYEVDFDSGKDGAESAAEYLSRHGVHAQIIREQAPDADFVEPLLLSKLESGRYGWAVMGAFSKSRFREAFFGGTTKRMLKDAPVPLFIAH
jgi:nucleotide-binding universal stress UspA family protein